jgi:hypothetical protein
MTEKKTEGCVSAAAGPIVPKLAPEAASPQHHRTTARETTMSVMAGKEAPDFEASAYHEGGFKNLKLSEFRGKWVFLCFYPGDFTFV